jgi:hypothetical protein
MNLNDRTNDDIKDLLNPERFKKNEEYDPIHSERHQMVKEIRDYFREDAKKGKGSFGYYLGFFFKMPKTVIYRYFKEAKAIDDPIKNQKRLFWWKIGKFIRNK